MFVADETIPAEPSHRSPCAVSASVAPLASIYGVRVSVVWLASTLRREGERGAARVEQAVRARRPGQPG